MRLRSLLFVPGDRPERFARAAQSGADAIIIDLEDSVALAAKMSARRSVAEYLEQPRHTTVLVRINPVDGPFAADDLAAVLPHQPDGIVLPKAEGAASIEQLCTMAQHPVPPVLPIATETPRALFQLGSYATVSSQLCGLTWGAEDLPAAIGATAAREADGRYTAPLETVRSLALFAAHAAGVPAIETVYPAIRDADGLNAYARRGRRDGFTGMMALHPEQVPIINAAFAATPAELAQARRVVAAFSAGAGVVEIDGQMVDLPHFKQAQALLAQADASPDEA
ncbi:CoA ester lyase [Croceicoccus sp. F390]|uniref:CoA ester lyase n=1 Tax=Croceicoccus esteveae TaxID=3075597 RepID=A0ABU2ZH40_9SPHN|nr:CoA ester lyase [Croceicoccus sp. F390]MDT0575629.1 CoA ester lyase [Croceicoccus sp. F390]